MFNAAGGSAATLRLPAKLVAAGTVGDTVMIDLTNAAARDGYYAIKPQTDLIEEYFTIKGVILGPVGHSYIADSDVLIQVVGDCAEVAVESTTDIAIGDLLYPVDNADYLVSQGATQPDLTGFTDNTTGTAGNTLAVVSGTYVQAEIEDLAASFALKINDILAYLKATGVALEARTANDEGTIRAFLKSL